MLHHSPLSEDCTAKQLLGGDRERLYEEIKTPVRTMDTETQPAHDQDFGVSQWFDMAGYNAPQHSPVSDFSGFGFGSSPVMPMEQTYSMSAPQPYTSQPLLPLTISPQWSGMMSTQPSYGPVPLAPMPPMPSAIGAPQPVHNSPYPTAPTPRRTLSDSDRRRMCLYHEENPNVKQTEIGGKLSNCFFN